MVIALLTLFTLIVVAFGISLTVQIRYQADQEAFETLCEYLRVSRRATVDEFTSALHEHIRLKAQQGVNILERLDGWTANIDRDIVREALLQHVVHLPPMSVAPCHAKKWWIEFMTEWRTVHVHVTTTLPAAQRHIRRTSR